MVFSSTLEVCAFLVSFTPTLFAFFGESFQTNSIYRYFSPQIPYAPPSWLFGLVWGALYPLLSYAFYCVITDDVEKFELWIILAIVQFVLLLLWPRVFTGANMFTTALVILLGAWGLAIYLSVTAFIEGLTLPGWSQALLAAWLTFAAYLNWQATYYNDIVSAATECRAQANAAFDKDCIERAREKC